MRGRGSAHKYILTSFPFVELGTGRVPHPRRTGKVDTGMMPGFEHRVERRHRNDASVSKAHPPGFEPATVCFQRPTPYPLGHGRNERKGQHTQVHTHKLPFCRAWHRQGAICSVSPGRVSGRVGACRVGVSGGHRLDIWHRLGAQHRLYYDASQPVLDFEFVNRVK